MAWLTLEYGGKKEIQGYVTSCRKSVEELYRYRDMIFSIIGSKELEHEGKV